MSRFFVLSDSHAHVIEQALLLKSRFQAAQSSEDLVQPVLQLLRKHPGSFHALATAADIFEGYRTSDALLPEAQLMVCSFASAKQGHAVWLAAPQSESSSEA